MIRASTILRNQEAPKAAVSKEEVSDAVDKPAKRKTIDEDDKKKFNEPQFTDVYDPFCEASLAPLTAGSQYSMRKTAVQAVIDVALMMANFGQLRTLSSAEHISHKALITTLVISSLVLQIMFAILIIIIWIREIERKERGDYLMNLRELVDKQSESDIFAKIEVAEKLRKHMSYRKYLISLHLNTVTVILVGLITILNMFISVFGIELEPYAV